MCVSLCAVYCVHDNWFTLCHIMELFLLCVRVFRRLSNGCVRVPIPALCVRVFQRHSDRVPIPTLCVSVFRRLRDSCVRVPIPTLCLRVFRRLSNYCVRVPIPSCVYVCSVASVTAVSVCRFLRCVFRRLCDSCDRVPIPTLCVPSPL